MKWTPCSCCGRDEVSVFDEFDPDDDLVLCVRCEEALEDQYRRGVVDVDTDLL